MLSMARNYTRLTILERRLRSVGPNGPHAPETHTAVTENASENSADQPLKNIVREKPIFVFSANLG